jgi:hypothetical protein
VNPPALWKHQWAGQQTPTRVAGIRGNAVASFDPWSKAAECDLAIERVADPERRIVLESLRSLWIDVCNSFSLVDGPGEASDFSTITQIHMELMAVCRTAMH